eukprot:scaffold6261_cov28-Tisochrysis_lutea.AAC.2
MHARAPVPLRRRRKRSRRPSAMTFRSPSCHRSVRKNPWGGRFDGIHSSASASSLIQPSLSPALSLSSPPISPVGTPTPMPAAASSPLRASATLASLSCASTRCLGGSSAKE